MASPTPTTATTARVLMQGLGVSTEVVGAALAAIAAMYAMRDVLDAGCGMIEFLPKLLSPVETVSWMDHFGARSGGGPRGLGICAMTALAGVFVRTAGGIVSNDQNIRAVERRVYGGHN